METSQKKFSQTLRNLEIKFTAYVRTTSSQHLGERSRFWGMSGMLKICRSFPPLHAIKKCTLDYLLAQGFKNSSVRPLKMSYSNYSKFSPSKYEIENPWFFGGQDLQITQNVTWDTAILPMALRNGSTLAPGFPPPEVDDEGKKPRDRSANL
ncbi:hypothetical protein CROQUDRAFT_97259 [Cronartium quercuum f. sp. fusiforme G11]|uniref:Uncharacterized protein n=1 Tax=Cronartium quercuum f. sp. fusiforme G11 TaxID=708437 RepID=A0A9P6NFC9_9BASI|nr:hypothetical protein CROQUDRAFT_97259 [Cronartium quercuum f. sp. fusiforme G11]